MKFSWQFNSLLLCGTLIVGCGETADSTVSDAPAADPAPTAPPNTTDAAPAADPLLEGIELEDPAEFAQIKGKYEESPTDVDAIMSYAGTLRNFSWAHAQRGDQERSDQSLIRGGELLLKAISDKVVLPAAPESTLSADVLYGYACVLSKTGKAPEALEVLDKAVELGMNNLQMVNSDKDLTAVRELPEFETQTGVWEAHFAEMKKKQEALLVEHAKEDLANGESFPFTFDLTDIDGKPISSEALKGRVAIVDIWGTWCPPCRQEVPSFVKLQDEYGKYGFQVVGLNSERGPSDEANIKSVQKFMVDNSMNYPCALITDEVMAQIPDFRGFPTTLFIDHNGKVRLSAVGFHELGYIKTVVETLLSEQAAEKRAATN